MLRQAKWIFIGGIALLFAMALSPPAFADPGAAARQLYERVVALEKAGDYAQAARLARELVGREPRNDLYLAYASHVERLAGEYDSGLQHALAAVTLNPRVGWYVASVAFNAHAAQDLDLAREYGQRVVDLGAAGAGEGNYTLARDMLAKLKDRTLEITWTLHAERGSQRNGWYYIPTPSTLPGQVARYTVTGARKTSGVTLEGNPLMLFTASSGQPVLLRARVEVRAHSYRAQLAHFQDSGSFPPEAALFLGASEGINPRSTVLQAIVSEVRGPNRLATVRSILAWMKKRLRYQVEDFENVEEIVARGHGECGGWSALFAGLCRAAGIPARVAWGMVEDTTPDRRIAPAGHLKGHAWAEFYLCGVGWVPVEPQSPETLGLLPTTYVRMYHWDISSKRWSRDPLSASENMRLMGGDRPTYRQATP